MTNRALDRQVLLYVTVVTLCAACADTPPPEVVESVTVSTGTQFTVDGRAGSDALIMDLQGMPWRLPIDGGEAVALTGPGADIRRPRISPDGRWIAFQTFERGVWDIGVMKPDGSDRRLLTGDGRSGVDDNREPEWSVDGESVLFSSDRAGNYDIWSIDLDGRKPLQITSDPADDYAPAVAAHGLVFISERSGQPALYQLRTGSGEVPVKIASAPAGRLHPPRFSPDGQRIAYVQAIARNAFPGVAINELVVRNHATGDSRPVSAAGADVFSAAPAWLDDDTLLYTADGLIQRVTVSTGNTITIPFRAELPVQATEFTPRTPVAFAQDEHPVLGIVDPVELPDGRIIFTALGDLWSLGIDGKPVRTTDDVFVERDAAVSTDGRQLAYISDRQSGMQVWIRDIENGMDRRITDHSAGMRYPTFSPDGFRLAYQQVGPRGTQDFTVRVLDLATGESRRLRSSPKIWPGRMYWSADGEYITVAELSIPSKRFNDGANRLVRINVAEDAAVIEPLPDGLVPDSGPVASPDGNSVALVIGGALWHAPTRPNGSLAGPPELVLDELVESPAWSSDSQRLTFLSNRGLETIGIETGRRRSRNPVLSWTPAVDRGRRLVHAGRLFDGIADTYIENVDIVIEGARIVSIEPHREHTADIDVIDAADKVVLPGLVDHHVHFEPHKGEWVGRAWLGFGVTTVVEPGGLPYESREIMEAWSSGRRAGPRLVFAGPQLDGSRRHFHFGTHINSDRRLAWEMERADRLGYGLIKTYTRLPATRQAKAVELAHALGLPVTAHAAFRNLAFGGDRIEHLRGSSRLAYSPKQSELLNTYADVEQIIVQTGATVTPTIAVAGGFFDYALAHPDYANNPQYVAFNSPAYRQGLSGFARVVGKNIELVRTGLANAQSTVKRLHDAGTPIVAGTDSPIFPYGLALVIELANYVDAGLTPAEALRTATVNAAVAIGAEDEIGRIQPGLLADLVIIDGDPLADISDLLNVSGVMTNGRYRTLKELITTVSDTD